jgi:thioredoxin reductase
MSDAPVVVVGAGPAGAAAALHLADAGLRVLLVEERPAAGGAAFPAGIGEEGEGEFLWPDRAYRGAALRRGLAQRAQRIDFRPLHRAETVAAGPCVTVRDLAGSAAFSLAPRAVVLATGARPVAPGVGGTAPAGVFGLEDPARLVEAARERPGARVVVAGTGPLLWFAAAWVVSARLNVVAIVDAAGRPGLRQIAGLLRQPGMAAQGLGWMRAAWRTGAPIRARSCVTAALGDATLRAVEIAALDDAWRPAGGRERIEAEFLCIGYGLEPAVDLLARGGGAMERDRVTGFATPRRSDALETSIGGVFAAGDGARLGGLDAALAEGAIAAESVLKHLDRRVDAKLGAAAAAGRRLCRALAPFLAALNDWAGARPGLTGRDQRAR